MIIPEKFQFTSDEDAQVRMKQYIRENFADLLGPKINLIDQPNGLDLVEAEVKARLAQHGIGKVRLARVA